MNVPPLFFARAQTLLTGAAIGVALIGALHVALSAAAQQASQPTFRTGTTLVEVSAIVTKDGLTVPDLTRDDVQVLDGGVPQPLVAFEFVDLSTAPIPEQRRDFVLVLDDLQIDARQSRATIALAQRLIDGLGASDRLAIVNTGPFELIQQLSTDRRAAHALVRKFRGLKGSASSPVEKTHLAITLLRVVRNVARVLASEDPRERRSIVVVSEGGPLGPVAPNQRDDDFQPVLAAYDEMVGQAALSNVAVYAVDPRGLDAPMHRISGPDNRTIAQAASQLGETAGESAALRRRGLLWRMADVTGGTLVTERNDLGAGLPGMFRDSRQYYRLAYVQPAVAPGDEGKARSIEVRVARPDTTVRARRQYLPKGQP
uniref:VWA domain-containing protein n=1 Tax=Luteitalea sp. TaxID=2004800 RepID=UPI0025C337FC|nr:VWA domain-containing protein [Luteitalea sp.]